jgi:AcrR family transcriptional regulator
MKRKIIKDNAKTRVGTAVREKGVARVDEIIRTAKDIFITKGLANLTTRQVANNLCISVGNLHYYFPTKDALLQAIINSVIEDYDIDLKRESHQFPHSPNKRLEAFIRYMVSDAKKPDTRGFFYQFWGLSTHNAFAASLRHDMYEHFIQVTAGMLSDIHPKMSQKRIEGLALTMLTFVEGLHVTYGSSDKLLEDFPDFDETAYLQIMKLALA